jgi:hypothetical protein
VTEWDGARNLAGLGGLPIRGGGVTAQGRVWRSAATEWLTDAGWRVAVQDGLARVIDLRNEPERGRRDQHPDARVPPGIEVVHAPTEDHEDADYLAECGPWLDHPRGWEPNLRRFPDRIARVFEAVATSPGPVLVHCAGGRDRTGMVSAMLLVLADVEHDAIVTSYEDGFRGAAAHRGHGLGWDPASAQWVAAEDEAWSPGELVDALTDRRPVLREWLSTYDVEGYLRGAGLSDVRIEQLRRLLRD